MKCWALVDFPARCKMCKVMHYDAIMCGLCWLWLCPDDEEKHHCLAR